MAPLPIASTLIASAPCRDGLIIAADTCATLGDGIHISKHKLVILTVPHRTVLAVAGNSLVFPPAPADVPTLDFLRHAQPLLNLDATAHASLRASGQEFTPDSFDRAFIDCIDATKELVRRHPELLERLNNQDFFEVLVANFAPNTGTVSIASRKLHVECAALVAGETMWHRFEQAELGSLCFFGEADYVRRNVLLNFPLQHSDAVHRRVEEISLEAAQSACVALVELACEIALHEPPASGIALPLDVILIGRDERPVILLWGAIPQVF